MLPGNARIPVSRPLDDLDRHVKACGICKSGRINQCSEGSLLDDAFWRHMDAKFPTNGEAGRTET